MKIKWTDEDREIPVETEDGHVDEIGVHRGKVVDLPVEMARSLVKQGHAEAHPDKKPAKKAPAKAGPDKANEPAPVAADSEEKV